MLSEPYPVPAAELPLGALREHLRLGTGFGDEPLQDGLLEGAMRAALGRVEAHSARTLIAREFVWRVEEWAGASCVALPAAPVLAVTSFAVGGAQIGPDRWFVTEGEAPRLGMRTGGMPWIARGEAATIAFEAGYGPWSMVPPMLQQASLMLAAALYEDRGLHAVAMPAAVAALIAPFRPVRIGGAR